jgi:hypothetical protein
MESPMIKEHEGLLGVTHANESSGPPLLRAAAPA